MTPLEMVKITFNLVVIYLIGGLVLAVVYSVTSPILYKKAEEEKKAALKTMMPEADDIVKLGDWEPHEKHAEYYSAQKCAEVNVRVVTDENTGETREEKECINPQDIGFIVEGFGKGYSSYIHVLASVDKDFLIQKISILGHAETPGLGDEIEKDYFLDQFVGKNADNLVVVKSETQDQIQAITGATISSRAVAEDGVRNGVEMLKEKLSGEVQG
jgi:electron transport complex protein RnfG